MGISVKRKVIPTICSQHCGGSCVIKAHVEEGIITTIETDDGEETQYRACLRGRALRQRVYAPDRLRFPLKRVGDRGEGKFKRVSWDEALDTIAIQIKRIRDNYGSSAILLIYSLGDAGMLHNSAPIERVFSLSGGYSRTWAFWSYEAGVFAELATYGKEFIGNTREDLLNSKLIILWGADPTTSILDTNNTWYLIQAKEAGIKIISIDPRHTNTAAIVADKWIPIIPGTDTAMLIAMAYVIITENLHDQIFLDTYTLGFNKFRDYVLGLEDGIAKTPAWAEKITGVPAASIEELARMYATTKPAALIAGIAPGRTAYGEQYHRAAMTLAAMTGNVGVPGGSAAGRGWTGFSVAGFRRMMPIVHNPVEDDAPPQEHPLPRRASPFFGRGSVNVHKVADAILKGKAGGYLSDYKMAYIVNSNYLNQDANINKTVRAFKALEFIVTQEQFMTPTAKFADIILPTTTFLERNDLVSGGDPPYYGYMNKVIEPIGECKSHLEIASELAKRLGVADYFNKSEEEWLKDCFERSKVPVEYESFKKKGIFKVVLPQPYVAFREQIENPADNPFRTPSGRIEIYSERLAELNDPKLPPIPKYIETWESRSDPLTQLYPLQLITNHSRRRAHSQNETLPWLRELVKQDLEISIVDAEDRGIKTGDLVRAFNERGQVIMPARVSKRIMSGVVSIPQGAWYNPDNRGVDRGGNPNVLAKDKTSPCGAFVSNTALIQVEKIEV